MHNEGIYKDKAVWQFSTLDSWRKWLDAHHATEQAGIWVKIAKKNKAATTITYEQTREGALCYGWIDSLPNKLDETFYLLKVTPRRPKSVWSKINVGLCELYIAEGKMQPSGMTQIETAKANGQWYKAY